MADSTTTTYSFTLPEVGASADSWGTKLNANWSKVDDLFDGTVAVTGINLTTFKVDSVIVTASAAELNKLDGLTATTTELNYVDGVTSNIQTQLDSMVEKAGDTMTGDLSLGDNVKAKFGASDDLQIYHDGSNSYIDDVGTGDLVIRGSSAVYLQKYAGENMLKATADAGVQVFYNNAEKLATTSTGVDVTGTVTADGLTVDDGEILVRGLNSTVNDNVPTIRFDDTDASQASGQKAGQILFESSDASPNANGVYAYINAQATDTSGTGNLYFGTGVTNSAVDRVRIAENGDVSFYEDTGTTAKMVWDASAESLGIGTSTPIRPLHVDGAGKGDIYTGIFTNSTTDTDHYNVVTFTQGATGSATGYLGTGGSTSSNASFRNSFVVGTQTNNPLVFNTNDTERVRIDSSGSLLVGTTDINVYNGTSTGVAITGSGYIFAGKSGDAPMYLNRTSNDGSILVFNRGSTQVGSVGAEGGDLVIGTGSTAGLQFNDATPTIRPWNMSANTRTDGVCDLGYSNSRFKDLYLSGGVYLGGTGAANKLDDYETGNWIPVISAGTASFSGPSYVKVGKIVTVSLFITSISDITSSSNFQISGLPFVSSNKYHTGAGLARYINIGSGQLSQLISPATSTINFFSNAVGANYVQLKHSDITQSSSQIFITMQYEAAS
jgi:hypothetical protein